MITNKALRAQIRRRAAFACEYCGVTETDTGGLLTIDHFIDLLLNRNDQVINLFEIKFNNQLFSISKTYFENLSDKVNRFKMTTKTRKQIFLVFITTFGFTENQYSSGIVSRSLTLEDLFREA